MQVTIITAGKHGGLTVALDVLPHTGDSFELDGVNYRVFRVLHKIILGTNGVSQRIALVLERT